MVKLNLPVDLRVDPPELVPARFMATDQRRVHVPLGAVYQVGAGLIKGHRVNGSTDANVVYYRRVSMAVAVAGRRYLGDEVEEKEFARFPFDGAFGIFGHFFHDQAGAFIPLNVDCFLLAGGDAATATYAGDWVNFCRCLDEFDGIVATCTQTDAAAIAELFCDLGGNGRVLLHFTGTA